MIGARRYVVALALYQEQRHDPATIAPYYEQNKIFCDVGYIRTVSAHCNDRGTMHWQEALYSERGNIRLATCQVGVQPIQ